MLFEPGPLEPFSEAEIPQAGARVDLTALAIAEAEALEAAAASLDGEILTLAEAGENALERDGAADLARMGDELARHDGAYDGAIEDVAAAADAGESNLLGFAGELAADLATPIPPEPAIPPDGYGRGGIPPGAPSSEWDAIVMQQVRLLTGTVPTSDQVIYARRFAPDVEALKAWILAGMPFEGLPPEAPPPAPGARWSYWLANDPFGGAAGQWALQYFNNPDINPWDPINAAIAEFRARFGDAAPDDDLGVLTLIALGQTP